MSGHTSRLVTGVGFGFETSSGSISTAVDWSPMISHGATAVVVLAILAVWIGHPLSATGVPGFGVDLDGPLGSQFGGCNRFVDCNGSGPVGLAAG